MGRRLGGWFAAFVVTLLVGSGTGLVPVSAEAPHVVSGHGITVSGWRWVSTRTLEVDISTSAVAANAVNGPHRVRVTLPVSYFDQPTERFPVLYLLHGGAGGSSAQWTTGGGDTETITRDAQLITVMPDGGKVGWYTNWVDQSRGAQDWPRFHLSQLIAWVDDNLRTVATKQGRAIAGLSMGGFGAIRYAQDRPDLFAYAASFSGALDLDDPRIRGTIGEEATRNGYRFDSPFGNPFPPLDGGFTQLNPIIRAENLRGVGVGLYAGSGNNPFDQLEGTVMQATERMHEALDAAGVPHFYWMYGRPGPSAPYGCDGGHNFGCWNFALKDALPRIMASLDAPPPPPPPPPPSLGVEAVANPGFEAATNAPWACTRTCGVDRGAGLARSGANNGWVRNTSGWNDIHQTIAVRPHSTYAIRAWVRTSANNSAGAFGLRAADGTVLGQRTFGALGAYTLLSTTVSSGPHTSLQVFAGTTPSGDTWMQVDDVSVVGQKQPTSTALTSSTNPASADEAITFTASVSPAPAPGETVRFFDDGTDLGTGATDASGAATLTTSSLPAGSHVITAAYGGNASLAGSTAPALDQVVRHATGTALVSSSNPSDAGEPVTFTASVSPAPAPGETVRFVEGAVELGTGSADEAGTATFTTSSLPVGSHDVRATYDGSETMAGSTSPVVTQVVRQPTRTSIGSSANPATAPDAVTFAASVSPAPEAGGTVAFYDGAELLGTGATDETGSATFTTSSLSVGAHSITAVYAGDGVTTPSTSEALHQVVREATATSLLSSQNPSLHGEAVTFTAWVAPAPLPGEPITFLDGDTELGTATTDADGVATLTTASLAVGTHQITAVYGGSDTLGGSASDALAHSVRHPTTTALTASPSPSVSGEAVTFVASPSPTPSQGEAITFFDGDAALGTATTGPNGVATLVTSSLSVGGHTITAVYGGSAELAGSTSPPLSHTVGKASTTTAKVTSTANPSFKGDAVTFSTVVSALAPGSGAPEGSVAFFSDQKHLGTATLVHGVASLTTTRLSTGSWSIWAVYLSDPTFKASHSGTDPLVQKVKSRPD